MSGIDPKKYEELVRQDISKFLYAGNSDFLVYYEELAEEEDPPTTDLAAENTPGNFSYEEVQPAGFTMQEPKETLTPGLPPGFDGRLGKLWFGQKMHANLTSMGKPY